MKYLIYWSLSKISLNKDGVMWRYFSQLNEMNMRRFFVWQKGQWSQLRYTDRKSWGWAVQRSGYIIRGRKLYVSVSCSNKISCPLLLILTWMMIAQSLKKLMWGCQLQGVCRHEKAVKCPQTRIQEFKCPHIFWRKIHNFKEFDTYIWPQRTYFFP